MCHTKKTVESTFRYSKLAKMILNVRDLRATEFCLTVNAKEYLTTNLTHMLKFLQPNVNHEGAFLNVFLYTSP